MEGDNTATFMTSHSVKSSQIVRAYTCMYILLCKGIRVVSFYSVIGKEFVFWCEDEFYVFFKNSYVKEFE